MTAPPLVDVGLATIRAGRVPEVHRRPPAIDLEGLCDLDQQGRSALQPNSEDSAAEVVIGRRSAQLRSAEEDGSRVTVRKLGW